MFSHKIKVSFPVYHFFFHFSFSFLAYNFFNHCALSYEPFQFYNGTYKPYMPIIPFRLLTRLYLSGHFLKYFIFVAAKHTSCKPFRPPATLNRVVVFFVRFCTTHIVELRIARGYAQYDMSEWHLQLLPCCREATSRRTKTYRPTDPRQPFRQEIRKKLSKLRYFTSRFCSILVKQSPDAPPVPVGLRSVIFIKSSSTTSVHNNSRAIKVRRLKHLKGKG